MRCVIEYASEKDSSVNMVLNNAKLVVKNNHNQTTNSLIFKKIVDFLGTTGVL